MVRISISQTAFEAVASTLPLGRLGYERQLNAKGESHVWLEPTVVNRLRAMRGAGKSYSDLILGLIEISQRDV